MVFEDAKEIKRLSGITVEWMRTVLKENPVFGKMLDADLIVNAWDRGEDYVLRGAPNLILAHGPKDYSEMHAVRENLTIAMTYLELAAFSMGLGCCWGGYFQAAVQLYPPMNEALGLPEGHISYECMMIGYPKYQYQRMPLRNEPKVIWK
jgi:nitroreductase